MNFFSYRQNNSGGYFLYDDGIAVNVIIQAENHADADAKAKQIGLYFDGMASGNDCECCGNRWNRADESDGHPFPHSYGSKIDVSDVNQDSYAIHFADGRIVEGGKKC